MQCVTLYSNHCNLLFIIGRRNLNNLIHPHNLLLTLADVDLCRITNIFHVNRSH